MPAMLARVYDSHASALYAFLLNLTRNSADTHDLLQDVFLKLAARPQLLEGVNDERAYLVRLAYNQFLDLVRRHGTRRHYHEAYQAERDGLFVPAADHDARSFQLALESALAELPEDQRAAVHLKLWTGLTFEQIAAALNLSPNTVASRYRYGIDKLRQRLRPLYEEVSR